MCQVKIICIKGADVYQFAVFVRTSQLYSTTGILRIVMASATFFRSQVISVLGNR
jgi:hypothetical protein